MCELKPKVPKLIRSFVNQFINIKEEKLDTPIFRIIDYDYVYEMLRSNTNTLVSPSLWADPFENILRHVSYSSQKGIRSVMTLDNLTFSQCWSFSSENDLLWRVYSPNCNSVRIKTTPRKLFELTDKSNKIVSIKNYPKIIEFDSSTNIPFSEEIEVFIGAVHYWSKGEIQNFLSEPRNMNLLDFISTLYIKREPFINENEFRIVLWHLDAIRDEILHFKEKVFSYDCPFNKLIEEVIFDPRISKNKFDALRKSLIEIGAECKIEQSDLYNIPKFSF